VLLTGGVKSCN